MATLTRQQLIDVIDQYIYANGQQRITAPQLHEILLEIANAFEMVGGGTASGIDEVLEEGSTVSDGREITNGFGGKIQLAVAPLTTLSEPAPAPDYKYVGINVAELPYVGQVYSDKSRTVIGNIKTTDLSKTLFEVLPDAGEIYAGTVYNVLSDEGFGIEGVGPYDFERGITTIYLDDGGTATHQVKGKAIKSEVLNNEGNSSIVLQRDSYITETITDGISVTSKIANKESYEVSCQNGDIGGLSTLRLDIGTMSLRTDSNEGTASSLNLDSTKIQSSVSDSVTSVLSEITPINSLIKVESDELSVSHRVSPDGVMIEATDGAGTNLQSVQGISSTYLDISDPSNIIRVSNIPSETYTTVINTSTEEYSRVTQTPTTIFNKLVNEDAVELFNFSMEQDRVNMSLFDPQTEVTDQFFLDPQENQGGLTLKSYQSGVSPGYGEINVRPTITTISVAQGTILGQITASLGNVNIRATDSSGGNSLIDQSSDGIEISVDDGNISLSANNIDINGELNFMKTGAAIIALDGLENVFDIPHGYPGTPGSFALTFSDGSNAEFSQSTRYIDSANITINCPTPPAAGSITVYWQVFR